MSLGYARSNPFSTIHKPARAAKMNISRYTDNSDYRCKYCHKTFLSATSYMNHFPCKELRAKVSQSEAQIKNPHLVLIAK